MQAAGADLVKHYRELAFMGIAEVLKNLPAIFRNIKFCKQDITQYKPDVLILVDYPGFNIRIAKWAKQQGLKVVYYIIPKVWAWKESRVKTMKKCIDKLLVILPFEKEFYKTRWNWEVEYVGHPLVEVVNEFRVRSSESGAGVQKSEIIALLPGSRKQEILKKLPLMLEVSKSFPAYQFIVAKAPGMDDSFYDSLLKEYSNVSYLSNQTYDLLSKAKAALVTSGTATLETALFDVPQVVCYKTSAITYTAGKLLLKIKYISLVNLIMDKPVVKELIQHDLTIDKLKDELQQLLHNEEKIVAIKKDYAELKDILSRGGNASAKAAASIQQFLSQ
jgi:lipid-A-disaccharide synthase